MIRWFKQLDDVLRGDPAPGNLSERRPGGPLPGAGAGLGVVVILLCAVYGAGVGSFSAIRTGGAELRQVVASAVKLPLLFFLTLGVTLPSLYVFSALVGARLRIGAVCRLLVAMVGVVAAVLASFAPIVVFFGVSTTSYPFMKLLNVAMCGVAVLLGLAFLVRTLRALVGAAGVDATESETDESADLQLDEDNAVALGTAADRRAAVVFRVWVVLFVFVGVQMSWVLRPFIGHPDLPFAWFRNRESNFFTDVWAALLSLFGG